MDGMVLIKVTIVLSLTLLVAYLCRRAHAATRHRLWTVAFVSVLALPLLTIALPALRVPVPGTWSTIADAPLAAGRRDDRGQTNSALREGPLATTGRASYLSEHTLRSTPLSTADKAAWPASLAVVWAIGTTAALAGLFVSLFRTRRLAGEADVLNDPEWCHAAEDIGGRLGVRRQFRLLVSPKVGTPMAGGVWRPVIFLPAAIHSWSVDRRDVVLAHEIAHVAGLDPLRHLLARIAVALYWFHPLIWIAARRATAAREEACDDEVLALGTLPSVYARTLLDLADSTTPPLRRVATLSMVERSQLELRLMTILKSETLHGKRRFMMPAIAVALVTLPLAAAQPGTSAKAPAESPISVKKLSAAPAQADAGRAAGCWSEMTDRSSFSGYRTTRDVAGRVVIDEQIGTSGAEWVIETRMGDLRLCLLAEGGGGLGATGRPSQWISQASRFVMESQRGGAVHHLEVTRQGGSAARTSWRIGGAERAVDAAAQQWRERMLALLDTTWELAMLRGEVSSLQGQVSSVRGQESTLRGEISSLQGEVSTLRGRASSIQGEESALRGQISTIQGHISSLQGAISSERGAMSAVDAGRYGANPAERAQIDNRLKRHEAEIARIERLIRDYDAEGKIAAVEKEIAGLRSSGRLAAIESEINAFDLRGKVAAVEKRIAALDVQGKVAELQRQINGLDADRRRRELESRRQSELKQLEAAISAVK